MFQNHEGKDNQRVRHLKIFYLDCWKATKLIGILFSRVKTEPTQDVKVHAKHMEDYYKQFTFDDKARMLSVVVHDNLDGDSLFVGHVGVLVPTTDGYLFVEKLTFEEPYQAIKFASKKDCYKYLTTKYKDYTGPGLAKPFIMDNGKWVDMD